MTLGQFIIYVRQSHNKCLQDLYNTSYKLPLSRADLDGQAEGFNNVLTAIKEGKLLNIEKYIPIVVEASRLCFRIMIDSPPAALEVRAKLFGQMKALEKVANALKEVKPYRSA